MTALAGVIGTLHDIPNDAACWRALAAQHVYGTEAPFLCTASTAALGVRAHEALATTACQAGSPDGRFLLVADIRLDNRSELLGSLGDAQQLSAESTDCEIVCHAWSRWGEACLGRIAGDFALAIYDTSERILTLARDASGQRPLFYGQRDEAFLFASMPSGILAGANAQADLSYLANIMDGIGNYGRVTAFKSVSKVLPGEVITVAGATLRRRFHWQPELREPWPGSDAELVEAYRFHLEEAVRCRMPQADGVVAAHLSSGYDSAAVTATAARVKQAGQRLIAYTSAPLDGYQGAVPKGRIADESPVAAEVAARHGIQHVVVRNADPLLAGVRGNARLFQAPAGDLFNLSWKRQILDHAAAKGARVLLTGALGNYTIHAGGLPVLRDLIRRGRWLAWWQEARAAVGRPDVRWRGALVASFRPWLPDPVLDAAHRLFNEAPGPSAFSFLREPWVRRLPSAAAGDIPTGPRGHFAAERLAIVRQQDPGAFRKGELAQSGIQECDPTADSRLIEFSLRLPPEQMLHRGVYRPLARAALADRLPGSVIDAPRRGYVGADWFPRLRRSDVATMIEEIATSPSATELIDLAKLRRAIEHWPNADDGLARVTALGRSVSNALAVGTFLSEIDLYPDAMGV